SYRLPEQPPPAWVNQEKVNSLASAGFTPPPPAGAGLRQGSIIHMTNPTTLDLVLKIIQAASTLAIGIAASFLAYKQFSLSRSKLRFDLYEKRLAVFKTVRDFASAIALKGEADPGAFYRDTIERRFLFEEDVYLYIEEMFKRAQELRGLKEHYAEP